MHCYAIGREKKEDDLSFTDGLILRLLKVCSSYSNQYRRHLLEENVVLRLRLLRCPRDYRDDCELALHLLHLHRYHDRRRKELRESNELME